MSFPPILGVAVFKVMVHMLFFVSPETLSDHLLTGHKTFTRHPCSHNHLFFQGSKGAGGADVHQSAVSSFHGALPVLGARAGSTRTCEKVIMGWADKALSKVAHAMVQVLEAARRHQCSLALRVNINPGVPGGCWSSFQLQSDINCCQHPSNLGKI